MKPLIGINTNISTGPPQTAEIFSNYYEAIKAAGGIPILIPPMSDEDLDEVISKVHGVMTIGGEDHSPSLYGEAPHPATQVMHPQREDFDLRLIARILKDKDLPALFACAGFQTVNILLGGSLIQDIETQFPDSKVNHRGPNWAHVGSTKHVVTFTPDSMLAQIYGQTKVNVPTNHHQAIKVLGKGLKPTATAEDGIIEAFEVEEHRFAIGVEWHPERDFETNKKLFTEFIRYCTNGNQMNISGPLRSIMQKQSAQ